MHQNSSTETNTSVRFIPFCHFIGVTSPMCFFLPCRAVTLPNVKMSTFAVITAADHLTPPAAEIHVSPAEAVSRVCRSSFW